MRTLACLAPVAVLMTSLLSPPIAAAQTTMPAADLAMHSGGAAVEDGIWRLDDNGFVGTYVRLDEPADVTVSVHAAGTAAGDVAPQMNVIVADERASFDVTSDEPRAYEHTFTLPVGTHFVRVEYANDAGSDDRALRVGPVDISGATEVLNENSDANALAAADTYINAYRRGAATVRLPEGVAEPGTPVRVKLRRHAFNFGVVASGVEENKYYYDDPEPGSDAWRFQRFIIDNFNAVVPGNAGKWAHNEPERGRLTMDLADAITRFAQRNNLRMRMHTLLWDTNQQPRWVSELLTEALEGDEQAKAELLRAVDERMEYYLVERGRNYFEIDGLNEHYHRRRWFDLLGPEGLAELHNKAAEAVRRGGGTAPIFTNEYNVMQWSSNPLDGRDAERDPYANWYREYVEAIRNAGGTVGGVGIQYYVLNSAGTRTGNPHSPARMMQVFQNMSVTGLPISLTEFGVQSDGANTYDAARFLDDSVRMTFGTPQANAFMIWGFWEEELWSAADAGALVDSDWDLLPPGRTWQGLMAEWGTDLVVFPDEQGNVAFTGFYGDYDITVGDRTFPLTLEKGVTEYEVSAAADQ